MMEKTFNEIKKRESNPDSTNKFLFNWNSIFYWNLDLMMMMMMKKNW